MVAPVHEQKQQDSKVSSGTTHRESSSGNKSALHGVGYEEGSRMLAPVQLKVDPTGYQTEGPNAGYSNVPEKFRNKQENYHESMLPGGKIHAQRQEEKFATDAPTFREFLGAVSMKLANLGGSVLSATAPAGGAAVIEAAGKVKLPLLTVSTKVVVEARNTGDGRFEVKGKTDFGALLGGWSKLIVPFLPDIKAAFGGSYEVKAAGDSINECMRLIQIGMELAMQNAADMRKATPEQLEAMARSQNPDEVGVVGAFLSWAWSGVKKVVNTIRRFPADTAEWSMRKLLNTIWVGDTGLTLDERLVEAAKEMGEKDKVEVTRDGLFGGETGGEMDGVGKATANASLGETTKTVLNQTNMATRGETKVSPLRKFVGEVDLSKIGLKGKLTYRVVKAVQKDGEPPKLPEGKLDFEFTVAMGLLGAAINAVATKIWSHLSVWLESDEAKSDDGKKPSGADEQSIAAAILAANTQGLSAIGRNAQEDPSKDAEVTAKVSWAHNDASPFHYLSTEIRNVAVIAKSPSELKMLGMGLEGSVKGGYSQTTTNTNIPKRKKDAYAGYRLPKGTVTESMGSE